ncbi:MAG TPA: DUF302 domain-containing protein [Pseudobdellovibrionaceae bacterium]|nr:DUF302 domain-containing protein [Pseudobdellovibrionaceae bacterium]
MSDLALTKTVSGGMEDVCLRLTEAIKPFGFGILTRIDFDRKIKEKIGKDLKPCVILGACNPNLAYQAYQKSSDTALLVPCNIVLTEVAQNEIRIEAMRPTRMLEMLPGGGSFPQVEEAERDLERALERLA